MEPLQTQILLVDDNPANLKILYETLDGRGYRLLVADSGDKALTIARRAIPDLVLLDIMMPGMDGFEVCRRIKADPVIARSSVIFLSALDDTESKVRGFDAGGVDYISKPFQVKEVLARVQTHLKIHALEQTLAARNRELAADKASILSAMSEGVYGLDQDGRIVFANRAAAALVQWPEPALLGHSFAELHWMTEAPGNSARGRGPDDVEGADESRLREECDHFLKALQGREKLRGRQTWFQRRDGSRFPVRYSLSAMNLPDHPTQAVIVFQDITEELTRQQELESVRAHVESQRAQLAHVTRLSMMGEMAAGIAHEVNQPLTAIVNYSRLARRLLNKGESGDPNLLQETLDKIEAQSQRASQVIQHIRNFVRKPTEGKVLLSASILARDILELARIESREQGVDLEADIQEPLPVVMVEPIQVQQVALNLIRNAGEAAAGVPGGPRVRFVVAVEEPGWVSFSVLDNGPGVAENQRSQLFQPFFTTKRTGMGIGLTLCQSIIHSHGGDIGYLPRPEGGSLFRFRLPGQPD